MRSTHSGEGSVGGLVEWRWDLDQRKASSDGVERGREKQTG